MYVLGLLSYNTVALTPPILQVGPGFLLELHLTTEICSMEEVAASEDRPCMDSHPAKLPAELLHRLWPQTFSNFPT